MELRDKHYELPKLRLWARMIGSGIHDSTDTAPNIAAFSGKACIITQCYVSIIA